MVSLLFNFFSWYWGCRPELFLFFLKIIIFLFFLLFLCVFFNIFESLCWQKKIKNLFEKEEKVLKKMLPLIDLGKITLFSISTLKNSLTILRIILDKFKDPDLIKNDKKFKKYLFAADSALLKIIQNSDLLKGQLCQEEDKRLFNLREEIQSLLIIYEEFSIKHKIKIELSADKEYRIYADCCHLMRALNILLLNAIEALSTSNNKRKLLTITFKKSSYFLKIKIEDNAGGIKPQLFNNLFTVNCFKKYSDNGLGLDLYFANEIMKKYFQKKIQIKSHNNRGTKMILVIKNSFVLAESKLKKKEIFIVGKSK